MCKVSSKTPARVAYRVETAGAGLAGLSPVGSACRSPDPQSVTVRVAKFELAPVGRLAWGPAELGHDRRYVVHKQVDQGVRPGIAAVLGKKQPRSPASDRHERRHAGLEAMLPLLGETQALIPGDCISGAGHTQHWDDFVIHPGMVPHAPGALSALQGPAIAGPVDRVRRLV